MATALLLSGCGGGGSGGQVSATNGAPSGTTPISSPTPSPTPSPAPTPTATGQLSVPTYPALDRLGEVERLFVSGKYSVEVQRVGDPSPTGSTVFETRNDWIRYDFFNADPARRMDVLRGATQYGDGKSDLRTASFTRFSFADTPVIVTVRVLDAGDRINSATIRPLRHAITPTIAADGKSMTFRLERPAKVSVDINDRLNPLFILTDAPEAANTTATHYFGPGIHRIPGASGTLTLTSGQQVYIAAGAIVEGRFVVAPGAQNVRIAGRGILSRGEWKHEAADYNYLRGNATVWSEHASNLEISGLTIVNSNAWQIAIEDYSSTGTSTRNNRYVDLNMITWNGNTDAFWVTGANNVVDNAFVFNNDDLIVSKGGAGTRVSNVVAWGSVWGRLLLLHPILTNVPNIQDLTIENVDSIGKEGENTLINFEDNTRGKSVNGVTIRNLRVEERRRAGNTNNNGYNQLRLFTLEDTNQRGSISNILLENVQLDQAMASEGYIRGSANLRFSNFTFRNFTRGGNRVLSRDASGIAFNEFVDNVTFE